MNATLHDLHSDWNAWAASAEKSEDGWQSDYPNWDQLMEKAAAIMLKPSLSEDELEDVEFSWWASEETEELADFAKAHLDATLSTLTRLQLSKLPEVRWQIYDVLGDAGSRGEPLLRKGLDDLDPYSRRRAILSLARIKPSDSKQLAERFRSDEDPYIRQAAREFARS
jgi:HEAT repeats